MAKKFLTVREFASKANYSERQVRQMSIDGKISAQKVEGGRKWLIPPTELDQFAREDHRQQAQAPMLERAEEKVTEPKQREMQMKHDMEVFEKSDAIMSERDFRDFLGSLSTNHSHRQSHNLKAEKFLRFFSYEGNQYVSAELRNLAETVCNALDALGYFLFDHFYDNPLPGDRGNTQFRLYPYFDIVVRNKVDETKWREEYDKLVPELNRLTDITQEAYKAYRATVRDTLYL